MIWIWESYNETAVKKLQFHKKVLMLLIVLGHSVHFRTND